MTRLLLCTATATGVAAVRTGWWPYSLACVLAASGAVWWAVVARPALDAAQRSMDAVMAELAALHDDEQPPTPDTTGGHALTSPDPVMSAREYDWTLWSLSVTADTQSLCGCGHEGLGPSWHTHDCPAHALLWRARARALHNRLWDLWEQVRSGEPVDMTDPGAGPTAIAGHARQAPRRRAPCAEGFRWLGQSLASCDDCGCPAWEHAGQRVPTSPSAFDADARSVLVPWPSGVADQMRRRWAAEG